MYTYVMLNIYFLYLAKCYSAKYKNRIVQVLISMLRRLAKFVRNVDLVKTVERVHEIVLLKKSESG